MRADRLLSLLLILQAHGQIPASELAHRLDVSIRTIYRDVEALSMAGVPIYTHTGRNGGIALDEAYRVALAGVRAEDLHALFITDSQAPLQQLGMGADDGQTVLKLLGMLSRTQQQHAHFIRQRLFIDPTGWYGGDESPHLARLQQAIWQDRRVQFMYANWRGDAKTVDGSPYGLVFKSGAWYLVAEKAPDTLRIYRVGRIYGLTIAPETFVRDDTFDLSTYWHQANREFLRNTSRYEVTIHLSQRIFYLAEQLLAHRYKILEKHEDAVVIRAVFGDLHEARSMLLSFGAEAIILSPRELYDDIIAHAQALLTHYTS